VGKSNIYIFKTQEIMHTPPLRVLYLTPIKWVKFYVIVREWPGFNWHGTEIHWLLLMLRVWSSVVKEIKGILKWNFGLVFGKTIVDIFSNKPMLTVVPLWFPQPHQENTWDRTLMLSIRLKVLTLLIYIYISCWRLSSWKKTLSHFSTHAVDNAWDFNCRNQNVAKKHATQHPDLRVKQCSYSHGIAKVAIPAKCAQCYISFLQVHSNQKSNQPQIMCTPIVSCNGCKYIFYLKHCGMLTRC
jgi:hypothetical protein